MTRMRPLLVLGTRPEAIKMAPVVASCRARAAEVEPIVCFTGQHEEMLRQVTDYFDIVPDFDLKVMSPSQSLAQLTSKLLLALDETIATAKPDYVVAQGDTTSVLAASLAAFYRGVPFVHVEAGLRTRDLTAPWPEEFNRRVAGVSTALHCAPTPRASENLRREGVEAHKIHVTGNTVIDALLATVARERARDAQWQAQYEWLQKRDLVLVTVHRRENHGQPLEGICTAIADLAAEFSEVAFLLPVHLNPQVQSVVRQRLSGIDNLRLTPPLAYPEFVWLMQRSKLIVSDSGGIQEEAPSLRRPVIALREATERNEAVEAGAAICVGSDPDAIQTTVRRLLTDDDAYRSMQIDRSPFGDGQAAERIVQWMIESFKSSGQSNAIPFASDDLGKLSGSPLETTPLPISL